MGYASNKKEANWALTGICFSAAVKVVLKVTNTKEIAVLSGIDSRQHPTAVVLGATNTKKIAVNTYS